MNRAERRAKKKDRRYTKKGFTRVVYINDEGVPRTVLTPVDSPVHKKAKKNAKAWHRRRKEEKRGTITDK